MESMRPFPPKRHAWERMTSTVPDMSRPPTGLHEKECFYVKLDTHGALNVCQEFFNKWERCRRSNPASFNATLVCRKFHEDYVECFYAEKKNVRDKTAKKLWADYERARMTGNLQDRLQKFIPIFSE